jgi:prepilin-type processing-associated H-X9-DG protein
MKPSSRESKLATETGRAAVTFVDVAACVVAMVILSGVALTTLGGVRTASQRELCLNNLRRIAAASADYSADDPRDNAVPVHHRFDGMGNTAIGDYQYGGKSGNVNMPAYFHYTVEGGFGSLTRPLNPFLYDVAAMVPPECRSYATITQECIDLDKRLGLSIYQCPTDTGRTGLHYGHWRDSGRSGYDYFGTSYNSPQAMICDGTNGPMYTETAFQRPRSGVPNPSRTMLYMETCGRFAWAWGYGPWGFGTDFTVGGWHGENWEFNMAYVDGHAGTIRMQGCGETGIVNSKFDVEYIPGLPGGTDVWWQVIIRGKDWQFDCLPAPAIPTNKRWGGGVGADAPTGPQPMTLSPPAIN